MQSDDDYMAVFLGERIKSMHPSSRCINSLLLPSRCVRAGMRCNSWKTTTAPTAIIKGTLVLRSLKLAAMSLRCSSGEQGLRRLR